MPIRYEFGWYVHNFFLELQEVIKSVLIEKDGMWQRYLIRDATIDFCGAVRWRRILWDCELLQQFLFHSQRKHLFLNYLRGCRRLPISNLWKSGVKMQGLSPAPVIFWCCEISSVTCFFKCFFFRKLDYLRWLFNSTISTTLSLHQYGRRIPNGMQKNRDALSRACWGNLWRRMTLDCQNSRKGWMALLRHSYARVQKGPFQTSFSCCLGRPGLFCNAGYGSLECSTTPGPSTLPDTYVTIVTICCTSTCFSNLIWDCTW